MKIISRSFIHAAFLGSALLTTSLSLADEIDMVTPRSIPAVPDDLIDDPHIREQLGVNQFTAPSIKRIFDDLDKLTPLPANERLHKKSKRMPLNRTDLALEIGFLIADGLMAAQSGQMRKVEELATELTRYGRALGAGDRVNRHAASLLDSANNNDIDALKDELTATQRDVETDLIHLRDIDLAHLISLGGWIRALEVSSYSVEKKYSPERAQALLRPDIANYYEKSINSLEPRVLAHSDLKEIRQCIIVIKEIMASKEGLTSDEVTTITTKAHSLAKLALRRKD